MSVPFPGSRLANLREKRTSQIEKISPTKQIEQPLVLPQQQDNSYQPSSMGFNGGRTATRFLKGRIQKTNQNQKRSSTNLGGQFNLPNKQNQVQSTKYMPNNNYNDNDNGEFKLILNDSPVFDKKKLQTNIQIQQPQKKRVLIQKKQSVEQSKPQVKQQFKQQPKVIKQHFNPIQQQVIQVKKQKQQQGGTIKQQDVQQSNAMENQNQLVQCPEGCGRKFNRKALQKHSKACKLVFMSKRKQFNSEAKRLTSTQQATLVKQNKLQQKKAQLGKTKGKFDKMQKTGDNWKNASEDFRSAIKAIKKQGPTQQQGQLNVIPCEFCQKPFAEVFLAKHLENCLKKKQKEQKQKKKAQRKK